MGLIGDIYYAFRGDGARLKKDAEVEGAKAGTSLGASMSASLKKAWNGKEIGKGLVTGLGFAGGLGAATLLAGGLSKVTDLIGDSISKASDLSESMSKVRVVFGDSADEMIEWSETAADAMGLSQQAALEASGTIGNLLLSMGKAPAEAAKMSRSLVQLAADLASFNNVDIEEVLTAMRSGLTGEIAPLRRFGVNLTDATLKAKAMQLGLSDGKKVLDVSAKSAAAYALILEQTTTAQGDFARTSDGLANTQRKVNARFEDLQAQLGEQLLPIMLEVLNAALDLADAFDATGDALKNNEDVYQNFANLLHDMFKSPNEDARTFLGTLFDGLNDIENGLTGAGIALHDWLTFWDSSDEVQHKAAAAADHTADSIEDMRSRAVSDLAGVSGAMNKTAGASGDMADDITGDNKAVMVSWDDLRDALKQDAEDLVDDVFDPIITADRLRANSAELSAQRQILASKTATAAQKRDARDKIHQLEKDNAAYLIELAEAGATNTKAYRDGITELKNQIKKAKGPAKAALQEILNKILEIERHSNISVKVRVSSKTTSGLGPGGAATGGAQRQGQAVWVGERGPELYVPEVDGRVLTASQSIAAIAGAGSGGGSTFNVMLPVTARPDPFETADALRRLNDFGVLQVPA